MVNLSSISGCGVIIQHYSLHIARYGQFFITWVLLCVHRGTCVLIISEIANLSSLHIAPARVHSCTLALDITNIMIFRNSIFFHENPMDSQHTIATAPI